MNVINRYLNGRKNPGYSYLVKVLYTADIETAKTILERTLYRIKIEPAYLTGTPSNNGWEKLQGSLANQIISDKNTYYDWFFSTDL